MQQEQGRLDLLVNAVWGGNELPSLQSDWGCPCWQQQEGPAAGWEAMFTTGVRPALIGGAAGAGMCWDAAAECAELQYTRQVFLRKTRLVEMVVSCHTQRHPVAALLPPVCAPRQPRTTRRG